MRRSPAVVTTALAVLGAPLLAEAALIRDGSKFRVNTYTSGLQYTLGHGVARAADGTFMVVWCSDQDGSESSVHARHYDATGAAHGDEFQVNTYTTSYQHAPAVAAGANGSFVVVWASVQDGTGDGIVGRRYDASGVAIGDEIHINSHTTGFQGWPAVAAASDGSFVVAWLGQDGGAYGIRAQRFDNVGARVGNELQVNTYTAGIQSSPAVAVAPDGSFVIVWESSGQDGDRYGVFGQRYDSDGGAAGAEFQINTFTTYSQHGATIAAGVNGDFVVAWTSHPGGGDYYFGTDSQDGSFTGVFGQRFDGAGERAGGEFRVNAATSGDQAYPVVAAGGDGRFLVVWSGTSTNHSRFHAQRYDEIGGVDGDELAVDFPPEREAYWHSVSADALGDAVVVWSAPRALSDNDRFAQLLCGDENANEICDAEEASRVCGDTADFEGITATDALFALRAAVGLSPCLPCVCDSDGSGTIAASDSLRILAASTGLVVELLCPACT